MKTKIFVGISSVIQDGNLIALYSSNGIKSANPINGINLSFDELMQFFMDLNTNKSKDITTVFVCFAFSADLEFIFSELPGDIKDKLFQSYQIKKRLEEIEYDQEKLDNDFYHLPRDSQEFEQVDFERYVNKIATQEILDVYYGEYQLSLHAGRILTVTKGGKRFTLYDVYGFFRCPLKKAIKQWLNEEIEIAPGFYETHQIARIADKLENELQTVGINLSRYYGTGAIASWILSKSNARKQYHNYRYQRQSAADLHKAVMQGYIAGRAEQFKIGTFNERINVYDINSAYAYASNLLPIFLNKPKFAREWNREPFSLWYCDYDFSSCNPYFGYLPNRDKGTDFISYKLKGKGYFYQPEVSWILQHFPQCIEIEHGYYVPYQRPDFADKILEVYELRKHLQSINHPLEQVLKLALSSLYGKFCQRQGKGYYYNMYYAGYITSVARMQLLEATKGNEEKVICFLTDAIHTTGKLNVATSNELGEFKRNEYESGVYLDNGVYRLVDKFGKRKTATRGFRQFDFNAALDQLRNTKTYSGLAEFFIGHNLHSFMPLQYTDYLKVQSESKKQNPFETEARRFDRVEIDLTQGHIDSRVYTKYNGLESGMYRQAHYKDLTAGLDSILAGRI